MFTASKAPDTSGNIQGRGHDTQTVIARGVRVEGDLVSQGNVVIDGEVQGSIQCSGQLFVGPEAKVTANTNAQEAFVSGMVEGNIVVAKRLDLKATARIIGDVQAESVSVEVGAAISGRMTVGAKPATQTRTASVTNRRDTRMSTQPAVSES